MRRNGRKLCTSSTVYTVLCNLRLVAILGKPYTVQSLAYAKFPARYILYSRWKCQNTSVLRERAVVVGDSMGAESVWAESSRNSIGCIKPSNCHHSRSMNFQFPFNSQFAMNQQYIHAGYDTIVIPYTFMPTIPYTAYSKILIFPPNSVIYQTMDLPAKSFDVVRVVLPCSQSYAHT